MSALFLFQPRNMQSGSACLRTCHGCWKAFTSMWYRFYFSQALRFSFVSFHPLILHLLSHSFVVTTLVLRALHAFLLGIHFQDGRGAPCADLKRPDPAYCKFWSRRFRGHGAQKPPPPHTCTHSHACAHTHFCPVKIWAGKLEAILNLKALASSLVSLSLRKIYQKWEEVKMERKSYFLSALSVPSIECRSAPTSWTQGHSYHIAHWSAWPGICAECG